MEPQWRQTFYWLSPLVGIGLQCTVSVSYLLWQDSAQGYGSFLSLVEHAGLPYLCMAGILSVFSYAYLAIQAWLPEYYVGLVILSLTVITGCSLYICHWLLGCGGYTIRELFGMFISLANYLLWGWLYFLPVYVASYLYIRQKRRG